MARPSRKYYVENNITMTAYAMQLEEYADGLEAQLAELNELYAHYRLTAANDMIILNDALDKACYELASHAGYSKEQWKEWALKDE